MYLYRKRCDGASIYIFCVDVCFDCRDVWAICGSHFQITVPIQHRFFDSISFNFNAIFFFSYSSSSSSSTTSTSISFQAFQLQLHRRLFFVSFSSWTIDLILTDFEWSLRCFYFTLPHLSCLLSSPIPFPLRKFCWLQFNFKRSFFLYGISVYIWTLHFCVTLFFTWTDYRPILGSLRVVRIRWEFTQNSLLNVLMVYLMMIISPFIYKSLSLISLFIHPFIVIHPSSLSCLKSEFEAFEDLKLETIFFYSRSTQLNSFVQTRNSWRDLRFLNQSSLLLSLHSLACSLIIIIIIITSQS